MSIPKRWSKLSKAKSAPPKPGVYELANVKKQIVKIGEGENLNERLRGQIPSLPKDVKHIRLLPTKVHKKVEKQMLEQFKKEHGKLPKYNERIG